MIDILEP